VIETETAKTEAGEARLRAFLAEHGVIARIIAPGMPMPTVPLAAAAIGVEERQIIKSVLFAGKSGAVVLGIACGSGRIDRNALATASGLGKLKLAAPEIVLERTGFPAGGVSPIGHATVIPVVIDRAVFTHDLVYGGAGSETTLLEIAPQRIVELTGAVVADIVTVETP
jgi:prolyl-tRNA editing enzyme YbaK/EbsC (Cys-tRNA(Pro) deacylase)